MRDTAPVIALWLEQGVREGTLKLRRPSDPIGTAEIVLRLMAAFGPTSTNLTHEGGPDET